MQRLLLNKSVNTSENSWLDCNRKPEIMKSLNLSWSYYPKKINALTFNFKTNKTAQVKVLYNWNKKEMPN